MRGLGGLANSLPISLLTSLARPEARGQTVGRYRFLSDGGFAAGPIVLGAIADAVGYRAALVAVIAAFSAVFVACWLLVTPRERPAPEPA